ncbi:sce7726 family protein [Pseudoalteromonas sp. RW-H-Ap-1]|uniref:sce7726 family protein n=1 Tax=Pseudoalteromonas sp. RW-H-Ap-1 TaxID=3241171 RepID=UPI00390C5206
MKSENDPSKILNPDKKFGPLLARVFSSSVFNELANTGFSPTLNSIIKELDIKVEHYENLGELFECTYSKLSKVYRNEYLYKNSIANKILLGKYSLNTASMLSEFRVAKSKADAIILNGTSHIYEIKTELDSLERLDQQLLDYQSFSEFVSVVTDKKHIPKLLDKIPSNVGLIELTSRDTFRTVKKPLSNLDKLCKNVQFDALRQSEYVRIVNLHHGFVPDVPNTLLYKECKKLFKDIPIRVAHKYILGELKNRNLSTQKKS